jgi:V-type H+-transporting ATPase subunit H
MLKADPVAQMSYQISFCFWLLTFDSEIAAQIDKRYVIIPLLVDIAQGAPKEKIIRVIMGTFRVSYEFLVGSRHQRYM